MDSSSHYLSASSGRVKPLTIVVKVGTSSLLTDAGYISLSKVSRVVEVLCQLHRDGNNVVLVSSGAVGFGRLALREQEK